MFAAFGINTTRKIIFVYFVSQLLATISFPCPVVRQSFAASQGVLARLGRRATHDNLILVTAGRAGESSFVEDRICPLP